MKYKPNAEIRIGPRSWFGPALVRKQAGTGGQADEVMFALVRKVTIKGDPYLVFDKPAQEFSLRQIETEYRKAFER